MNILRSIFTYLALLEIENVLGDIPLEYSAQIIEKIYRQFHSNILFLLSDPENDMSGKYHENKNSQYHPGL